MNWLLKPNQEAQMDGTILRETLQAILPQSIIEALAEKLGVIERTRKRDIVKLVYSLVLQISFHSFR
jgi:hypothetical protein